MSRARLVLMLAVVSSLGFLGAWYLELRGRALAERTATSFFGSYGGADGPEVTVGDSAARQFPMVIRGPQSAQGPHALRLVFQAEAGQAVHLGVVQFDGPEQRPLRLAVHLNDGPAVTLATTPGTGREPETIEHGVTGQYEVALAGAARCGRNEVRLRAESGDWTALSRLDVFSPPPSGGGPWSAIFGPGALLAWAAWAVLVARRRPRPRHVIADTALLVVGCALGLGLAEGALRLFGPRLGKVKPLLHAPGDPETVEASSHVLDDLRGHRCAEEPCTLYDCGFRLNRQGFHTHDYAREKEPGVTRVLGLGDSFMEYSGPVPHPSELLPRVEAEARRAAPEKRFEFINLGFSCAGLVTERAILEGEGLRLSPDAIVWTLYMGNDVTDETDGWQPPPRVRGGPPSLDRWWGRSLLFRFVSHLAWLGASDPQMLFASCAAIPADGPGQCGRLERSAAPYDPAAKTRTDEQYRSYALSRIGTLYLHEREAYVRGLIEVLVGRLTAIQTRLGTVPTVFVLIPDELQVSPSELDRVLAWDPALSRARLDVDYITQALSQTLPRKGLDLIDLTPSFKSETARGRRLYQPNDGHFSADGAALAAQLVGDGLRRRGVY